MAGDLRLALDDPVFDGPPGQHEAAAVAVLVKAGFARSGKQVFIDGTTGQRVLCDCMSGYVPYVKLDHMVARKAYARATGPVRALTRQPTEGRRQGGGLKFGPMEVECVVAHSAAEIVRERMLTAADPYEHFVCGQCGFPAEANVSLDYYLCRVCGTGQHVRSVTLGFASKLMCQELAAMGIKTSFRLKPDAPAL